MAKLRLHTDKECLKELLCSGVIWRAEGEPENAPYPLIQNRVASFGAAALDEALPEKGLISGAIHEWMYQEAPQDSLPPLTIISILVGNAVMSEGRTSNWEEWHRYILWIGKECWPTPYLLQKTLPHPALIKKCLFLDIQSEKERLWTIDLALRSEAAFATVAYVPKLSFPQSKRLTLALSHSDRFAFFLRPYCFQSRAIKSHSIKSHSAAATRWLATPHVLEKTVPKKPQNFEEDMVFCWKVRLLKKKGPLPEKRLWPEESDWLFQIKENAFSLEQYTLTATQEKEKRNLPEWTKHETRKRTTAPPQTTNLSGSLPSDASSFDASSSYVMPSNVTLETNKKRRISA